MNLKVAEVSEKTLVAILDRLGLTPMNAAKVKASIPVQPEKEPVNLWPNQADRFSTLTFSLGLIFVAFLTLVPASLFGGAGVFGLIGEFFGVIHEHWHTFMS